MSESATLVSSKILSVHLGRDAYVYVRQSTLTQVREHTESLARQYELAQRAVALGWDAHQVKVIDADLGRSGAEMTAREGFKELVAEVGLGQVGIIFGIEVSRLARNNADWYQLLDLCTLTDTLIADSDGVYHPGDFNDRLVLGLKGTMSEAELHLIRSRLTAGLRHKAARGELRQGLPVGFDYDPDENVVLAADEAVIEAIATVFRRFAELGSARQVMLSLREEGLLLPRRPGRTGRIQWAMATYPAVHDFLTNPCYAGAFVFGRNRSEKRLDGEGRVITRTVAVPRDQWAVLIPEHHRGFIDWPTFEANTAALRANWRPPRGSGGGAAREGAALLQGRIRCGRCGRMMQTSYSGTNGNSPRYLCARAKQLYGHEKSCQSIGGRRLEQRVLEEVFAVLEPAALAATAKALRDAEQTHATHLRAFTLSVERARFDVDRARRQYDAVEPENRLVARTLERSLETKLTAQRQAERDLLAAKARRPVRLSDEELAWLSRAGADVRAVFAAPSTTFRERKQLLRAILTEVVLTVDHDKRAAAIRIIWQGGSSTELAMAMNKTGAHARTTNEDTVSLIGRLAGSYDDTTIALILGRQKRLTGTGLSFTKARVKSLRVARGIPAYEPADQPVSADEQDVLVVNVPQAERILGVGKVTIYRWLADGFLTGEQLTTGAPWRIRIDQAVRDRLAPEVPEGWLRLADAAKALGMARQTVLHKVQSGELEAVQVNQGRRKGLRINVTAQQTGLFDQP
jgi:DNA invertase Pin-like site-specific DNA recombinase/predicted DNA-binding transcriptional regulator AlpA